MEKLISWTHLEAQDGPRASQDGPKSLENGAPDPPKLVPRRSKIEEGETSKNDNSTMKNTVFTGFSYHINTILLYIRIVRSSAMV